MSFSAPSPPDPTATSNTQQQYNVSAAQDQQKINSFNQSNPYGSMSYVADPNSPSGYTLNTSLSAPQQHLLDIQTGTQGTTGQTAQNLARNTAGMYSQAPNFKPLDTTGLVTQLNDWQQKYQQPLFNQQSSNLEAQLRDQGLTPNSEAYNNAKNLLARNQGDVQNQFMTNNIGVGQQAQAQNFGQQVENYQAPLQTLGGLFGMSGPTGPTFANTPTAQIQPANYAGAAQNAYQGQLQNYENTWNNIGKLGTAGVGLAMAPMTGGGSLAGMFGKGITGGGWG